MKFTAAIFLLTVVLCGQTPPAAGPVPAPLSPQANASATVPPDTVVAEIEGKKLTAADVDKLLGVYPFALQQAVRSNPTRGLPQLYMLRFLADQAVKRGLDQQSPYKETLEYQRLSVLYQAEILIYRNSIEVKPEEQEKFYKEHPEKFQQAKVRVILVAFNPLKAQGQGDLKLPAEAEAKAKADDLRKQILAGADFGKLARENSADKGSAEKGGDFGLIQKGSPYPDALKNVVFALKPGDVSEPVKQPSGFYLIRVDEFTSQPFEQVNTQIVEEMRQTRFNEWLKGLEARFAVKIDNPTYFAPKPQGVIPPPAPPSR